MGPLGKTSSEGRPSRAETGDIVFATPGGSEKEKKKGT
jgi:hypothetical protein